MDITEKNKLYQDVREARRTARGISEGTINVDELSEEQVKALLKNFGQKVHAITLIEEDDRLVEHNNMITRTLKDMGKIKPMYE